MGRTSGAVSAVKDQGSCGSCWAFATVEIIESYLQINSQQTIEELSAQHITSCTPNELQCEEMVVARDLFHNWDSLILNSLDWYLKQTIHTPLETLDKLELATIAQTLWILLQVFEDTKLFPEMITLLL